VIFSFFIFPDARLVKGFLKCLLVSAAIDNSRGLGLCPCVRGLAKDFVVEVDDVITQDSEISFIKAWTSGQPVQVSEVWRKILWSRLMTSSAQCECSAEILQLRALRVSGPDPYIHDRGLPFIQ
jgi:hypothetical protein